MPVGCAVISSCIRNLEMLNKASGIIGEGVEAAQVFSTQVQGLPVSLVSLTANIQQPRGAITT
ncbi:hypothetical protein E2C01_030148 [Portunus trituberculatus]|uniref:Uncharacterized protein n=1 Tax=Portunus trituberculatus TaxID=210409 RepID=A0A5B7EPP8_PORTR|nr:hypothetical protein [Portunus trituberculatus]